MKINSAKVKEIMKSLGVDLCGIASLDRFDSAPKELEADELKEPICNNCNLCVEACPVNALENPVMNQQTCWDYAFGEDNETQTWRIACHKCRDICPYNLGSQNSFIK